MGTVIHPRRENNKKAIIIHHYPNLSQLATKLKRWEQTNREVLFRLRKIVQVNWTCKIIIKCQLNPCISTSKAIPRSIPSKLIQAWFQQKTTFPNKQTKPTRLINRLKFSTRIITILKVKSWIQTRRNMVSKKVYGRMNLQKINI